MQFDTFPFGQTSFEVLNEVVPETYNIRLNNCKEASLLNLLISNKESNSINVNLNKLELIRLLNSLKQVYESDLQYWTTQEAEIAYKARCEILLTLGIEEI